MGMTTTTKEVTVATPVSEMDQDALALIVAEAQAVGVLEELIGNPVPLVNNYGDPVVAYFIYPHDRERVLELVALGLVAEERRRSVS